MSGANFEVRVLFFSKLREISGADEIVREVAAGATVGSLLAELHTEWPELRRWDDQLLFAVDQEYADRSTEVKPGSEVAVMPPVQGG